MKEVIILGDGILGSCLGDKSNWEILSRKKDKFDITDLSKFDSYFKNKSVIVNCIANTDTYSTNQNHWKVNYDFVVKLTDFCKKEDKKLIHISTGYVYANNKDNPKESDIAYPQNTLYAYTKLLADEYIKLKLSNYLIVRSIHKKNPFPYEVAFDDHYGNFSYVDEVSNFIISAIDDELTGIYNVGNDYISIYEFAKTTNPNVVAGKKLKNIPEKILYNCEKYKNYLK
jgi:dTDP-4-dehydrorhamnose reductase